MYSPSSFEEAVGFLSEHGGKPIAGGTALNTLMKERVLQPDVLVNLRSLRSGHDYVTRERNELRIGALTPLRAVETNELVRDLVPVVSECLSEVASIRIRNVATLGGNLAHADPDLDLPPVLAGLDARIVIQGVDDERDMDIKEFIKGYYQTDLEPHELIKEVRIPLREQHAVYLKHRSLSEADWPCVGVASVVRDDDIPEVYLNSVADTPIFTVSGLEDVFSDGVTEAAIEEAGELAEEQCDPVGDTRGSVWYKRRMAGEFTERAIRRVMGIEEVPSS